MKATDNQNLSDPLRLTPQQQRVLEALKDRETEEYPLSRWYLGALYTLHNEQNPDRIAQAAHSLRELIEKLPRVVEGSDVQGPPPNFHQSRDTIRKLILKDKENYASGWENRKIDRHLDNTLKQVEKYLESSRQPSRRERMQIAVTSIDPMANRFHKQIREGKRDELYELWKKLEGFTHHNSKQSIESFKKCLEELENTVFDLLAPITAENQKEIQTILQNANRSDTDIEKMFSLIESRGANYVFFFRHAAETADTAWLALLKAQGYFSHPPKAEPIGNDRVNFPFWWPMHYLTRMARYAPDDVIDIVLQLPKADNALIYNEILEMALRLLGNHSAKLQPKILEYARLEHHFMAYRFADVLAHWTTENQTAAALKLASALVEFLPDPQYEAKRKRREEKPTDLDARLATLADTRLEPAPRFGDMEYRMIMNKSVRPLAEKEPYKVACILIDATANMIGLRTHREDVGKDIDSSDYWFGRLTESESDYENDERSLVHTLTFTCQQVYEKRPDLIGDLDAELQSQPWRIFKRLRQHLLARYPTETTKPWIQALVRDYDSYDRWEYNYELQQMIRSACENFGKELLTKRELKRIFDCIRSGPSKYDLSEEEFRQHQRRFHRTQFTPFASVLFDEYKSYFQELEDQANAPISDDDYPPHKTRGGRVFKRSPRSPEDLAGLTDDELLALINEWDKKEDIYEGNNLIEVDIQGLSIAFQTVFKEQIIPNPKRHKFWMQNYHKIERPIFVERMINVMRECVEAKNFNNFGEWLTFSEWALSHPDDSEDVIYDRHAGESRDNSNWSNTRWAMGNFIASCFRQNINPPMSARAQLAKLLDTFCTQFDWRLDRHLTGNKLVDASTDTPRCRALEALVNFGFWLRSSNPEADVPEVTTILGKRLAPEAEHPLTPPEYAILGKNYNRLFHLNDAWTSKHKSVLFPRSDFSKWLAAINGFLSLYGPSASAFESLQDEYEFALQNLKQLKKRLKKRHSRADQLIFLLGKHLFTLYLLGKYPLTGNESLLEEFYKVTGDNSEHWARLFEDIGRDLSNSTKQLDTSRRNKFIEFFNWRLTAQEPRELREFTFWFNAERLNAQWRLNAYSEILDITKSEDVSIHMEVKVLCDMLPDHTAQVVECFHKLTDNIGDKNLSIFTEEATTILQAGFGSSDENVRQNAIQARENLLRLGRYDLLDIGD